MYSHWFHQSSSIKWVENNMVPTSSLVLSLTANKVVMHWNAELIAPTKHKNMIAGYNTFQYLILTLDELLSVAILSKTWSMSEHQRKHKYLPWCVIKYESDDCLCHVYDRGGTMYAWKIFKEIPVFHESMHFCA